MEEHSTGTAHRPPVGRRPVYQLVTIGAVSTAIGIAVGLSIDWFPTQASTQAHKVDTLYHVLIIVTVPIFVLVETIVLFSVWKFRMRPGEERLDGPPIHGNTRLEVIWTSLPAALIAGLCVYAFIVLHDVEAKPAHEMEVNVYGQQFAWSFQYPAGPGGHKVVADELYLPVDQPVRFRIHSVDVIHAFWIPAFRIQEDAVPGVTTNLRATPNRLGTYEIICNELCGLGHALMRSRAHVVTASAFNSWLAARGGAATVAATGSPTQVAAAGKQVFLGSSSCGACHKLADAQTAGAVGPNLDTALKGKSRLFIKQAIVNPYAHLPKGYGANIMPPNYGSTLSQGELNALTSYLAKVTSK
jgi:cytochrome c oxidase subunit II